MSAAAASTPGTCLQFNGTNGYVSVPHAAALNAYPLTITAWIKTSRVAPLYDGIASKYPPAALDGFSFFVYQGRLRAWYFRNSANYVWNPSGDNIGIDGGPVADGSWHHVAFVVGPITGSIYVDGTLGGSLAWTGAAGPPATNTAALLLGRAFLSPSFANTFSGQIDELTCWNRALTPNELNYLKHRRLSGKEDSLLAYYRFDEGAGSTATNSVTNAFNGAITPNPTWAFSQAAIALEPMSTNCLRFSGANGYVQVAHNADLNAYPFTATGWFRTTNAVSFVQGIVSKYRDSSMDGWSLFVQNGFLRGFFYRQGTNRAIDATYGVSVADGGWHHAALTVDATGGKLFLDGTLVGSSAWQYTPGSPTAAATEPLQIGRYYTTYTERFDGALDEITVWNRALAASEIQTNRNLPRLGNEPGLIGYWRLDEGTNTTAADSTAFGHTGTLISNPVWTGSTAYLGDGSVHLLTDATTPLFGRQWAVAPATNLSLNSFTENTRAFFRRFNDFGPAPPSVALVVRSDGGLQAADGTPVSVNPRTITNIFSLTSYNASTPQPTFFGSVASINPVLNLQPAPGVQLDSVSNSYQAVVTVSHNENGGAFVTDAASTTDPARLLHFNGNLYFGSIQTIFTSIGNGPVPGVLSPGAIATQLGVNNNSGTLTANTGYHYGNGSIIPVTLIANGDAFAASGTTVALTGSDSGCISNICFTRTGLTLSNSVISGIINLQLPLGLSVCTNFDSLHRLTLSQVSFPISFLDPANLNPLPNSLTQPGPLYVAEETKPFWVRAPALNWQVNAGQIVISNATTSVFVRQEEDDVLTASAALVTDTNTTRRVSNDAYYRNASNILGGQVTFVADANGVARMNARLSLNPPELRPHFPYSGNASGSQIHTAAGGQLAIVDDLIDTANSLLPITATVPLSYARDCFDTNCAAATIIPATLAFTANGNQLNFTPDGGLLAYGSVPPTNLTWGYAGSGFFAQRTSDVQAGAYHMPGNFLRYDQTAFADTQRPGVLLFSGYGNDSDPAYLERPGQAVYADGFANYAGLNFRAPAQGRSYIAHQDTGWFDLTSRSKYYARFGGISGIHEAANFQNNLALYGYPFTFLSYRLSYLDSDNWESRTDGAVSLPVPAGFVQEFSRMKFVCKGDLDSAQVPSSSLPKHMDYWNTWITPLTVQFNPLASDVCGTSGRFLVLGVETKLPFLGQAFHATLGFKNNGNLVTAADGVKNVDSRFKVPGHLTLQGPGTSTFPLETASDAYFNNWETPGKPGKGFYNVVGKLRVPFFSDVKVQLHVMPTGSNTSQIYIMGGWPSADGEGEDRGWTVAKANYFNTSKFDKHADGWPQGISIGDYRLSPTTAYHPRVQRNWIDVAKFDYALQWNAVLHEFAGFADTPVILPVIDVNSRLKELSPGKVDFDFAQDITVQLPHLKVLDFANDALNEINGPINSVSNAIRKELGQFFDTTGLTAGFRSLQNGLREDASGFFRPVLQSTLAPAADQAYALLAAMQNTNAAGFRTNIAAIIAGAGVNLQTSIRNINGAAGQANTVFGQLNQTLLDVDKTVGLFLRVLEKDPNDANRRHIVREIIKNLLADQGPVLSLGSSVGDGLINGLLGDLEPTLAKVEAELTNLRGQFNQLRSQVAAATGDFSASVASAVNEGPGLAKAVDFAGVAVSNLLATTVAGHPDYFTADPNAARQAILDRLIIGVLSSPLPGSYQETFRQFMFDNNFVLDQLMDVLFDQINRAIRDAIGDEIHGAGDGVFQAMKGVGKMSQSLLSAKIRGAPTFEGDSLRRIHLDAAVQMNLPDEMHFNAYMDIKELTSATMDIDCIPAGGPAAEVTLGAKDVPLDWLGISSGKPMTLTVEGRWTLQHGSVLGIGGLFDINGEIGFKGCSIREIGATFAFGELENYFAARAKGTITVIVVPVDVEVGIFAGHACSLEPLKFVDPDAGLILGDPASFTGIYVQYGGGLDLAEILFGESSCWLDVRAGISTSLYYQGGPRSGKIGFRQKVAIDLSLACVISGHVDVSLAANATYTPPADYELNVIGDATLCGSLGYCPFCIEGCKGITIKGVVKNGHIDYHID